MLNDELCVHIPHIVFFFVSAAADYEKPLPQQALFEMLQNLVHQEFAKSSILIGCFG